MCEDGRRKTVRKPRSGFTQDVFSAEVWLASAPLHEAGKTTRSGNTLKTGIGRGQLSFASDNPSSNPNACPLISTFSKPHSEVASTTHTSALKCFRKDAQRFSTFIRPEVRTAKSRFYAHTFPRISSSAFLLLVWHLTTSALHLSASSTAQRTILWDTVFVKSTIRSGLPICLPRLADI